MNFSNSLKNKTPETFKLEFLQKNTHRQPQDFFQLFSKQQNTKDPKIRSERKQLQKNETPEAYTIISKSFFQKLNIKGSQDSFNLVLIQSMSPLKIFFEIHCKPKDQLHCFKIFVKYFQKSKHQWPPRFSPICSDTKHELISRFLQFLSKTNIRSL